MTLKDLNIDNTWTLFLDRDGVINKKLEDDYVKHTTEFEFIDGSLNALRMLNPVFGNIVVVTNQQCIGKKIIFPEDLELIHKNMMYEISYLKGRIDKIYYSPYLAAENHPTRKPAIGMALQAQKDFPAIDFSKSIIVGDSLSDMEFGRNAGMKTVYISEEAKEDPRIDYNFKSLIYFAHTLTTKV
jgi:histidinol-phosphate phosphatase family protein